MDSDQQQQLLGFLDFEQNLKLCFNVLIHILNERENGGLTLLNIVEQMSKEINVHRQILANNILFILQLGTECGLIIKHGEKYMANESVYIGHDEDIKFENSFFMLPFTLTYKLIKFVMKPKSYSSVNKIKPQSVTFTETEKTKIQEKVYIEETAILSNKINEIENKLKTIGEKLETCILMISSLCKKSVNCENVSQGTLNEESEVTNSDFSGKSHDASCENSQIPNDNKNLDKSIKENVLGSTAGLRMRLRSRATKNVVPHKRPETPELVKNILEKSQRRHGISAKQIFTKIKNDYPYTTRHLIKPIENELKKQAEKGTVQETDIGGEKFYKKN